VSEPAGRQKAGRKKIKLKRVLFESGQLSKKLNHILPTTKEIKPKRLALCQLSVTPK
jgi:hypothetical protein